MKNKLQKLRIEFLEKLALVTDLDHLNNLEKQYLSRKGELSQLMRGLKDLGLELRKEAGSLANIVKNELENKFQSQCFPKSGYSICTSLNYFRLKRVT